MTVAHVVLPTLAVFGSWIAIGTLLAGCGFLARRAVLGSSVRGLARCDLWLGLAALLAYLELWSLAFSVSWAAWVAPAAIGIFGVAAGGRGLRLRLRSARPSMWVLALAVLGMLWLANQALAAIQDYDFGLYHLNAITYALKYPAIPGLGNIQSRLGANDGQLLLASFFDHRPWSGAGLHLANGLLVAMLFVDVAWRFAVRPAAPSPLSFAQRLALLLVPATIVVAGISPGYRLTGPNLDLAAYVPVVIGALYLAEFLEGGLPVAAALTSISAFTVAAVTRPLYALLAVFAVGVFAWIRRHERRAGRSLAAVCALPGVLVIGCVCRQAVLSGYPFFPVTAVALPVDWRVPKAVVSSQNAWNTSWARWPGKGPTQIGGLMSWLPHWLRMENANLDVIAPLALLVCVIPLLAWYRGSNERRTQMLAIVIPCLVTLVAWFAIAPDPRFAIAPIWLLPIALVAWALPPVGRLPVAVLAGSAVVALALVEVGAHNTRWLLIAAFDVGAVAAVARALVTRPRARDLLAHVAVIGVSVAMAGLVARSGAFDIIHANQGGPLGTAPVAPPGVVPFPTTSGFQLTQPAGGGDQCWQVILCAPQPKAAVRLRGASIGDGFTVKP